MKQSDSVFPFFERGGPPPTTAASASQGRRTRGAAAGCGDNPGSRVKPGQSLINEYFHFSMRRLRKID